MGEIKNNKKNNHSKFENKSVDELAEIYNQNNLKIYRNEKRLEEIKKEISLL